MIFEELYLLHPLLDFNFGGRRGEGATRGDRLVGRGNARGGTTILLLTIQRKFASTDSLQIRCLAKMLRESTQNSSDYKFPNL